MNGSHLLVSYAGATRTERGLQKSTYSNRNIYYSGTGKIVQQKRRAFDLINLFNFIHFILKCSKTVI